VLTLSELPGDPKDAQSRYVEAAVGGILVGCLYAPNGNPQPGPKFDYKLAWLEQLIRHVPRCARRKPGFVKRPQSLPEAATGSRRQRW
jgi:exonuclease III